MIPNRQLLHAVLVALGILLSSCAGTGSTSAAPGVPQSPDTPSDPASAAAAAGPYVPPTYVTHTYSGLGTTDIAQ